MIYKIIATGSAGNAVVLNNNILIDCGVSFKALKPVYNDLKIVLLTHEHSDHFNKTTIAMLARERPTLRFACCEWLVKNLLDCNVSERRIDVLKVGVLYNYGAFKVSPVRLYHDVKQCGYRVFVGEEKAFYATDTCTLEGISAEGYDLYLIEANYENDELQERINAKLQTGQFCYEMYVANRHLSKEQADKFLLDNMTEGSEYVYLHGHKEESSNDCNGENHRL